MSIYLRSAACLFISCLFFPITLMAWNATGHMVIADIGYQNLKPEVREKIDAIIHGLTEEYPMIRSFQQAAFWPDAIREQHIETFTHWHYVDNAISTDGSALKNLIDTDNALWAYPNVAVVVKNIKANKYERARFLSFLIHLTGDLHQPLHTVSNITSRNPDGDKGGNLYTIHYRNSRSNLHKLWDGGVGEFDTTTASVSHVDDLSAKIMAKYPAAYFGNRASDLNPENWIKESMENAKNYVYTTPQDKTPSEAYISAGRQVAEQQAALAGYRLANMLNHLLA